MEPERSQTLTVTLDAPGAVPNEDYCMVTYTLPGDITEHLWFTQMSLNLYPELTPENADIQKTPYFPIVPIRENNVTATYENRPELAKSANAYCGNWA